MPANGEYLPTGQSTQASALAYRPAAHSGWQLADPASLFFPLGHGKHGADWPSSAMYWPAGHAVHPQLQRQTFVAEQSPPDAAGL